MNKLNINTLIKMFEYGAQQVSKNFEYINKLNVFPVPDGDTGTNMKITITSGYESIKNDKFQDLNTLGKTFSRHILMNARGNSGVIFSQIIKGFTKSFKTNETELSINDLILCFNDAKEIAYKSVVQPIEGTILTVIRVISENLNKNINIFNSIEEVFKMVIEVGKKTLDDTPNMLPELKQAGVVDSGGYGLIQFLIGMENALLGKENFIVPKDVPVNATKLMEDVEMNLEEDGHGYCTEFLLGLGLKVDDNQKKNPYLEERFRKEISKYVDSMVLVSDLDEKIVKLHVHTLTPDKILRVGSVYGEFIKIKIENMNLQVSDRKNNVKNELNKKGNIFNIVATKLTEEIKVVATAPSSILGEFIKENYYVTQYLDTQEYGNPSVGQFIELIKSCNSKNVIVVIDDKNILLAAQEAAKQLKKLIHCQIIVGRNFVESIAAISAFVPEEKNIHNNVKTMNNVMKNTASAVFSNSVKNIKYPHITVRKNDIIGIVGGKIMSSEKDMITSVLKIMNHLIRKIKKPEILIIIYGSNVPIREVRQLETTISEKYGIYCESINGGQKVYPYLIGIQ